MVAAAAVIVTLVFFGWLLSRAITKKPIKAHMAMYGLSTVAGGYTYAFFLDMDNVSRVVKIFASILGGILLIVLAAWLQRRAQRGQPS